MRPFLWFLLGLVVALSGQSFAEGWVNEYGNSLDYQRGYGSRPGQPNYRDSNGTMHYPPPANPSLYRPC
jgi:hypothetical protein